MQDKRCGTSLAAEHLGDVRPGGPWANQARAFGAYRAPFQNGNSGPPYMAVSPSCSSIRNSWLYLASRSVREALPVLIWPVDMATARSAMVASSLSPLRWLVTAE